MDMKLKESCEKALDEIELLEFELENAMNFNQRLDGIGLIIKKLFLLDLLKLMLPVETELSEVDLNEFRSSYREWIAKIDALVCTIQNGNRLNCNDSTLCILEKMLPYFKGNIDGIKIYKKSRKIHIAA